jgi:opacity protein-like surface antigen
MRYIYLKIFDYLFNTSEWIQKTNSEEANVKKTSTFFCLTVLLLLSSGFLLSNPPQTREIKNIYFQKGEIELLVFIEHSQGLTYESFTLFSPNRLVIDFPNTDRIASPGPFEINAFGVRAIRTGKPNPYTCRVVFDLEEQIPRYRIADTDSGLRVSFWMEKAKEIVPEVTAKPKPKQPVVEEKRPEEKPAVTRPERQAPEKKARVAPPQAAGISNMGVGAFAGLYFMQDEVFQEAYGKMSFGFGGEYFFQLQLQDPHAIDFWLGFAMFSDNGLTTFTEEEIKLSMTHTSLALRYNYKIDKFTLFIGPGIDYIFYKETLPEDYPIEGISGSTLGFHLQLGAMMDIIENLAAHIYGKYNIARSKETISITEEEISVNLGGIQWGIGLIYRFNI